MFSYYRQKTVENQREIIPRNHSSFDLNGTHFKQDKTLGSGQSGEARLFRNESAGQKWVVKKPHAHKKSKSDLEKELAYYKRAYPKLTIYHNAGENGDYRLVLPYLGKPLFDYIKGLTLYEAMVVFYSVINELERLHAFGITHYDITAANILINKKGIITFIDGITHCVNKLSTKQSDIQMLTDIILSTGRSIDPLFMADCTPNEIRQIKTLNELREKLQHSKPACVLTIASFLFYQTPKALSKKCQKAIKKCEKALTNDTLEPVKTQALTLIKEIKEAVLADELTETTACQLLDDTAELIKNPTLEKTNTYLQRAKQLESNCSKWTRRISKTMVCFSLALIPALFFIPAIGAIGAVCAAFAVIAFGLLAYLNDKTPVQKTAEKLAQKIPVMPRQKHECIFSV